MLVVEVLMTSAHGAAIRAARDEKGWSARQLARRAGMTVNALLRLEAGQEPRIGQLARLAEALGWGDEVILSVVGGAR